MKNRYARNSTTISFKEQEILEGKKVLILGAGGLGGDVIDGAVRLGIGHLRIIDFDSFEITNLNRQLLSNEKLIGKSKAERARDYVKDINSEIDVETISEKVTAENIMRYLKDIDLVWECTDSIETKILISKICQQNRISFVYGVVAGDYGIAGIDLFLSSNFIKGIEKELGNMVYTVKITAAVQLDLGIKILLDKMIPSGFLYIDMKEFEFQWIEVKEKNEENVLLISD